MTERERCLTKLRALLDAADLLLTEANRNVPTMQADDHEGTRDVILNVHNHIRAGQRSIHFALTASDSIK